MTPFERLCQLGGESVDIFVGPGYARILYAGLEVIIWLVDPGDITEMEQDEQEEPC